MKFSIGVKNIHLEGTVSQNFLFSSWFLFYQKKTDCNSEEKQLILKWIISLDTHET